MKRGRAQAESSAGQLKSSGLIHSLGQARPPYQATEPLGLWRKNRETGNNTVGFSSRALLHLQDWVLTEEPSSLLPQGISLSVIQLYWGSWCWKQQSFLLQPAHLDGHLMTGFYPKEKLS